MTLIPEIAVSKKVLDLTTLRHQLIANNIANANTPKYKRTDLSFAETLNSMGERKADIQKNGPGDLMTEISADLSKGKEFAFLRRRNSDGDLGMQFAKGSLTFDYDWFRNMGEEDSYLSRQKNKSELDAINETQPILIETSNSERIDENNVNVDLEVSEMIKNTGYYNMLVSIVSADFRMIRTIISAR